jgi:hypothetical protein
MGRGQSRTNRKLQMYSSEPYCFENNTRLRFCSRSLSEKDKMTRTVTNNGRLHVVNE